MGFRITLFSLLLLLSQPLFCGETRLEWNKLIFGNGGGFEDVNSDVIMADPRVQALNISNIPGDYFSKAVNVTGPYFAREPFSKDNTFAITDTIEAADNENTSGLTNTANVLVGDLRRAVILFSSDRIDHRVATPTGDAEFAFSPGLLRIQPSGEGTLIGMKSGFPLLNIFNENGEPRVGIGTSEPGTALTVDGDIKIVNGTAAGQIGVFQAIDPLTDVSRLTSSSSFDYETIASKEFSVDYVTHSMLFIGSVSASNPSGASNRTGSIRLLLQEEVGGSFVDSTTYTDILSQSIVSFDSSNFQDHYSLTTTWSGDLAAGASSLSPSKRYRVLLQMFGASMNNRGDGTGSGGGQDATSADSMGTDLLVLGLPGSELTGVVSGPAVSPQVAIDGSFSPTALESGNFFTTNKVLFANGGRIADSASAFVVAQGSQLRRFKATKLLAVEHHEQDILEVIRDVENTSLLDIGSPETLHFVPDYTTYSWNHMNIHTTAPTLNIPSIVNISSGAFVVSGNVGIGTEPTTTYALKINGSLGFSGNYIGKYGVMNQVKMSGNYSVANNTSPHTFFSTSLDLSGEAVNHDAVVFANVSLIAMEDVELWIEVNGQESKRYRYAGDSGANASYPFALMFSVSNLNPQNHTVNLRIRRVAGSGNTVSIPAATDGSRYGASVVLLAVPSG